GRGVDQAAAALEEDPHHLAQRLELRRIQRHLVAARGADADRGDRFSRRRDGAHEQGAGRGHDVGDGADRLLPRLRRGGIRTVLAAGGERGEGQAGGGETGGGDEVAAAGHAEAPGEGRRGGRIDAGRV